MEVNMNMQSDSDDEPLISVKRKMKAKQQGGAAGSGGGSASKGAAPAKPAPPRFVTNFGASRKKKLAAAAAAKAKKQARRPASAPKKVAKKVKKVKKASTPQAKKRPRTADGNDDDDFASPARRKVGKVRRLSAGDDHDFVGDADTKPKRQRLSEGGAKKKKAGSGKPKATARKQPKKAAAPKRTRKATPAKPKKKKEPAKKVRKELKWAQKVDRAVLAFKWWEATKHTDGSRWSSLEHCGVMFPPAYKPHGVPLHYDGEAMELTPAAEELATFYAEIKVDGPQLGGDPKIAKLFNKNFFADFKKVLPRGSPIKSFDKCDFSLLRQYVAKRSEKRKARSKEEKEAEKEKNNAAKAFHMYAFVDGHVEKLGNCLVEPPGLFRGRGQHPRTGTHKRRLMPEQITINIGKSAVVPACPLPGHAWKNVVHDPKVTWLATWTENVMGQHKYVFLAASSGFKGESDLKKYEKARELKKYIGGIRKAYIKMLKKKDLAEAQVGTAMWVIDVLAIRVGNEKDEDEADTVGCCSLRVEHLTFDGTAVTLSFLGKDSMPYRETIDFGRYEEVGELVLRNLQRFTKGKKKTADVFDRLTPTILNKRLNEFMPGLSAKVFRTYNASITLERELPECDQTLLPQEKLVLYNDANRAVAILCNHQRTVPKSFAATYEKLQHRSDLMQKQIRELRAMKRKVAAGEEVALRPDDANKDLNHMFKRQPSVESVSKRLASFMERHRKLTINMKNKNDNKTIALNTAKINYMDPRITVAWCKRVQCPIEKVFSRQLRDKFPWAMSTAQDWKF